YAASLGLAFQVVDDILDETMDSETLGKTGGADRARDKPTYATMLGLDRARQTVAELHAEALESLATIRHNTAIMRELAEFVVKRTY
ncbi:MAG: geranyl transferase, partial [Proteobacteria bacterium]